MKNVVLNHATHTYYVDSVQVPHFHSLVESVGVKGEKGWNSLGGSEFMNNQVACENGTEFHTAAEYIVKGVDIEYDPAMENLIAGLKSFLLTHSSFKTVDLPGVGPLVDVPLYSKALNLAFTPDWVVEDYTTKRIWVVDWKSTMSYQRSWDWQVAGAYKLGLEDVLGGFRVYPMIVQFDNSKKTRPKITTFNLSECSKAENDFRSIYNVWKLGR